MSRSGHSRTRCLDTGVWSMKYSKACKWGTERKARQQKENSNVVHETSEYAAMGKCRSNRRHVKWHSKRCGKASLSSAVHGWWTETRWSRHCSRARGQAAAAPEPDSGSTAICGAVNTFYLKLVTWTLRNKSDQKFDNCLDTQPALDSKTKLPNLEWHANS